MSAIFDDMTQATNMYWSGFLIVMLYCSWQYSIKVMSLFSTLQAWQLIWDWTQSQCYPHGSCFAMISFQSCWISDTKCRYVNIFRCKLKNYDSFLRLWSTEHNKLKWAVLGARCSFNHDGKQNNHWGTQCCCPPILMVFFKFDHEPSSKLTSIQKLWDKINAINNSKIVSSSPGQQFLMTWLRPATCTDRGLGL